MTTHKIDIEEFKSAWQNEALFEGEKPSKEKLRKYMQSSSKSSSRMFRNSILVDVFLKLLLLFVVLWWISFDGIKSAWIIAGSGTALLLGISVFFELRVLGKFPSKNAPAHSVKSYLDRLITFYDRYLLPSVFLIAFTALAVFFTGSVYYFYIKYGEIRAFDYDDAAVMLTGLMLSYGISFAAHRNQFVWHIRRLKSNLKALSEDRMTVRKMYDDRRKRRRRQILISILLLAGVFLFLFLILVNGN